jgi:hypothetical protein
MCLLGWGLPSVLLVVVLVETLNAASPSQCHAQVLLGVLRWAASRLVGAVELIGNSVCRQGSLVAPLWGLGGWFRVGPHPCLLCGGWTLQ